MDFTIAVHGSPYASNASQSALAFASSVVAAGHSVTRVFFFHEGVLAALNSAVVPQDELNVTERWSEFAAANEVELAVCVANGLKRGVLNESERERYETPAATLANGFEIVGLGQLIDAIVQSDRYVEFPA